MGKSLLKSIKRPLIYLACPYSKQDNKQGVFLAVSRLAGKLVGAGNIVYSPITHTHPMVDPEINNVGLEYWWELDQWYLDRSDILMVCQLPGWDKSKGIKKEIKRANELGRPIIMVPYTKRK